MLSAFALAAVAGFAVPLLDATAAGRTQEFVLARTGDLDRFAALAQQAGGPAGADTLAQEVQAHHAVYGEGVVVVDRSGRAMVEAGLRAGGPAVVAAVDAALRNQPAARPERLRPWSTEPILLARPIGTGTQVGGAVVLRAEPAAAAADIGVAWAVVLLGALLAAVACAALALLLARWVLRPVRELAAGVGEVAAGHPGAHVSPHAGPTELRDLATAFNRMSDAVATSAEQQRRLVADTSHQLRNPLAALRLRVDTLDPHIAAAGRTTYHSTVVELDRLEALLDGLLDLASAESRATDLAAGAGPADRAELTAVVAERLDAWRAAARRAGVAHRRGGAGAGGGGLHGFRAGAGARRAARQRREVRGARRHGRDRGALGRRSGAARGARRRSRPAAPSTCSRPPSGSGGPLAAAPAVPGWACRSPSASSPPAAARCTWLPQQVRASS